MDAQQLRELATNALTGFWPKHLGLNTDAERIDFLARKLEAASGEIVRGDEEAERAIQLEEQNDKLRSDLEFTESKLSRIRELTI